MKETQAHASTQRGGLRDATLDDASKHAGAFHRQAASCQTQLLQAPVTFEAPLQRAKAIVFQEAAVEAEVAQVAAGGERVGDVAEVAWRQPDADLEVA